MTGLLSSSSSESALRVSVSSESSILPAQGPSSFRSALEPVYVFLTRSYNTRFYTLDIPPFRSALPFADA